MENTKIIEKIKKLLALSQNNSSKEESESAMLKAQSIMVKNNIEMSDVNNYSIDDDVTEDTTNPAGRIAWWKKSLAACIANNFKCKVIVVRDQRIGITYLRFIGHKEDLKICMEVYGYAVLQAEYLVKQYVRKFNKTFNNVGIKNDFLTGFICGIRDKFKEQVEQNNWGLIVVCDSKVTEYVNKINTHKTKSAAHVVAKNSAAKTAGYNHGHSFEALAGQLQ